MSEWLRNSVVLEKSGSGHFHARRYNSEGRSGYSENGNSNGYCCQYSCGPEVEYIAEIPEGEHINTSAILYYCKRRMLQPYMTISSLLGWRKLFSENYQCTFIEIIQHCYVIIVFSLMTIGFLLQYFSCFSRDMPHEYAQVLSDGHLVCQTNSLWLAVIPGFCYVLAYINILFITRAEDNEKLQILMEMALIQTSYPEYICKQKRILNCLRGLFISGLIMMLTSLTTCVMMVFVDIKFEALCSSSSSVLCAILKWLLIISCWMQDMAAITIVTSYAVQCQLFIMCLNVLEAKVIQASLPLPEATKDLQDISLLLDHVNNGISHSVGLLFVKTFIEAFRGIVLLDCYVVSISVPSLVVVLTCTTYVCLLVLTLIQASRLSGCGDQINSLGRTICVRPFGYENTSPEILNSFLALTGSYKFRARILAVPIHSWSFTILLLSILAVMVAFQIIPFSRFIHTNN